jgi:hypothetical protein
MVSPRVADVRLDPDAAEFVRFCYRRRSVGWPDLYDEMCAVASRRLFRGWDQAALGDHGVGFGLFELPALAALTAAIVAEEQAARPARPSARSQRGRPQANAGASVEATSADAGRDPTPDDRDPGSASVGTTSGPAEADRSPETDEVAALALAS